MRSIVKFSVGGLNLCLATCQNRYYTTKYNILITETKITDTYELSPNKAF